MKNARVIIGACLGDEGKGKVTDYYSRVNTDLVVRFNGGAQAAHTVVKSNGDIHVFNSIGSGALNSVPTYLSEFFIFNPLILYKEIDLFYKKFGFIPDILIDENSRVSTIYDMALNTMLEEARGNKKHGSCGIGINETVTRDEVISFKAVNLTNLKEVKELMEQIREEWFLKRVKELDLSKLYNDKLKSIIEHENSILNFWKVVHELQKVCSLVDISILKHPNITNVIFEGAQGLLLDEEHEWFPHVTRSKTGLQNALDLIQRTSDTCSINASYIMRPYMTRHGAGPLPYEKNCEYNVIEDKTNVPNVFQGALRFGLLDIDFISSTIKKDIKENVNRFNRNVYSEIVINCMDHCMSITNEKVVYINNGNKHSSPEEKFISDLHEKTGIRKFKTSYSRKTPKMMMEISY